MPVRLPQQQDPATAVDPSGLVARSREGDQAALRSLLEAHHDYIRSLLFRLVGPDGELDDLQQTVLLRIVTSLSGFRAESSVASWIRGICVHVARDHLRRKRTRRAAQAETPPEEARPEPLAARAPTPAEAAESSEQLRAVYRALDQLSPNHRTVLVLRLVWGHSVEEIARLTSSALSTTRLRLYYARRAFMKAFAEGRP